MKRLDVDDNTAVSLPVRNLLTIIGACLVGAWFGFGVLERLNSIESDLRLMHKEVDGKKLKTFAFYCENRYVKLDEV